MYFLLNKCLTRLNETRDLVFKNLLPIIIELGESVFSVLDEYIVYSAVLPRITIHVLWGETLVWIALSQHKLLNASEGSKEKVSCPMSISETNLVSNVDV